MTLYLFGIAHCFADLILDRVERPSNVLGILAQSLSRLLSGVCRGFRHSTRGAYGVSCDLCLNTIMRACRISYEYK